MDRPRFRAQWRVDRPTSTDVALTGENGYHLVGDPALSAMAPHLDGAADTGALLDRLKDAVSPPEFFYALMTGEKAGYLADAARDGDRPWDELAFWDLFGAAATTADMLCSFPIALAVHGSVDVDAVRNALIADGLDVIDDQAAAKFTVAVVGDLLDPRLAETDAMARASGQPWMIVRPTGLRPSIGPIIVPGQSACWSCLAFWLRGNREVANHVERTTGTHASTLTPTIAAPGIAALTGAMAAVELARFIARAKGMLVGTVLTVDPSDGTAAHHTVIHRPHCPTCGTPATGGWTAPELESRRRRAQFSIDGSLARLRRLVDPLTGLIHLVERTADDMDGLLHCCKAIHPFPMVRTNIAVLSENRSGRSGAAAFTEEEAELGTLGEAVERLSGVWLGEHEPRRRATRTALGAEAIDLDTCLLFSEAQRVARSEWNATVTEPRELVPAQLDPDQEIDWSPVWSLADGHRRLLPSAYLWYGHPEAALAFCYSDSNGCAAGERREHAVLSGLLELVERDAVAIWWYNRLRRPAVDLDAFDLPFVDAVREALRRRDRDLTVLDLTHDLGIPVFVAVSIRHSHEAEEIMLGFGSGLDPRSGILAALREMAQFYPIVAQSSSRGRTRYHTASQDTIRWLTQAKRASEPHLTPLSGLRSDPSALPDRSTGDVRDDVTLCVDALFAKGIDCFVLDQTRPDIGIETVRVVAPGLRHFWRRLAPGRLYDVPVGLGWRDATLAEADLNPTAIFL